MKIVIEMKPQTWALVREGQIPVRAYECIVKGTPLRYVLDEIRTEIDQKQYDFMESKDYDEGVRFGLMLAYQIIDKYAESEE